MLKRLTLVILVTALAWSGYWFWGRQSLAAAYETWFTERRADGWQADYAEMAIRGFPNRHDTTWTDLSIADPDSGLAWRAPFFQLFLLSYDRHHAIAVWPERQAIATPDGEVEVTSGSLQASIRTEGPAHELLRANLVADVLNLTFEGATTALAQMRLGLTRSGPETYDIALAVDGLALPDRVVRATGGALPETFQKARLQARVGFAAPWQLASLDERPQPQRIDLDMAELEWGPMALRMTGELEIDEAGRGTGNIHLQARNWREMLSVARASGRVPDVVADGLEATLSLMAQLSGSAASLDVTLRLDGGRIWLGPVPLGEAPRFLVR